MSRSESAAVASFTPGERAHIRRELDMFFSTLPSVADGYLQVWRGGPQAGEPKLPPIAKGLVERGLMRLDATLRPPRVLISPPGSLGDRIRSWLGEQRERGIEAGPLGRPAPKSHSGIQQGWTSEAACVLPGRAYPPGETSDYPHYRPGSGIRGCMPWAGVVLIRPWYV